MLCCCVFPPPGAVYPGCGCMEGLDQERPGPAAVRWLAGFRDIVLEHCPFLRHCPRGALLLHSMFWVAQAWVTHVNHRLGRWQRDCFPSAPIVCNAGVISMWRLCTGSPGTSLGRVPACDRWAYAAGDDGLRLARARRHLEVPWAARAVLVGPGCGQCGRVLMLDALLDLPGPEHGDWAAVRALGCWLCPPGRPVRRVDAAKGHLALGGLRLAGGVSLSALRCWPCLPPGRMPLTPSEAAGFRTAHQFVGVPAHLAIADDLAMCSLCVLSLNCGGMGARAPAWLPCWWRPTPKLPSCRRRPGWRLRVTWACLGCAPSMVSIAAVGG